MRIGPGALAGLAVCCALTAAVGCDRRSRPPQQVPVPEDYASQVQAWRDQHEVDYRRDYVTIAGLAFLEPGTHTVGSAPGNDIVIEASLPANVGRLTVEGDRVRLDPAGGLSVTREGKALPAPVLLKEAGEAPAKPVAIGGVSLTVHLTGGRLALRTRDPKGAPARSFTGFTWFPIDPAYRVTGRFLRDESPSEMPVINTFNGVDRFTTEGVIEFQLHGRTLRFRPFTTRPNRFYIVFRDASSGEETYEAARFLYADLHENGSVVLDFNQAYNPPCAFNAYTTCPLPLKENVLPVKVLAGEQAYRKAADDRASSRSFDERASVGSGKR
jgi:uncharacterized protein (DUF1684 family)